jgi:hypothetical protein
MVNSILIARSSKDQHDVSCNSQIFEMEKEAKARGEIVLKKYSFPQINHTEFSQDPAFSDILAEVKSKNRRWTKIWFYDTSRISSRRFIAQQIKAFFKKRGIDIQFFKLLQNDDIP